MPHLNCYMMVTDFNSDSVQKQNKLINIFENQYGLQYQILNGADEDVVLFRKRLFKISGRLDYPQMFIEVAPCRYVFIGGYDEIEQLLENDSIPPDQLEQLPDLPTFTRVFKQFIGKK